MAWVRIHDQAMGNLKILRLSDSAFRLWVKGLSYCQTHLTDGLIPREALSEMGAKRRDVELLASVIVEKKSPLWETVDGFGFKCHDYLTWNDCREKVIERQDDAKRRRLDYEARKRVERQTNRTRSERVPNAVPNTVPNASKDASITKPNQRREERESAREGMPDSEDPVATFIRDTYPRLYAKCRNGAFYRVNEARDFGVCQELVDTYGARVELLLEYFLALPPGREVLNQPGTPRQLKHMAPMCDAELRRHGR